MNHSEGLANRAGKTLWAVALTDWIATDGQTWLYLFKVLAAAFVALWISMKLALPQPRTALTTVMIVMQPQAGMVLGKSLYRILGTIAGLLVMLALIAIFGQQRELFILSTAIWVGVCTAGAAFNRQFRSYGFVLAGYTACLIGFPASQTPDATLMLALNRVAEIVLGILSAGAASALIFPQLSITSAHATVDEALASFLKFTRRALASDIARPDLETTHLGFARSVVQFEAQRVAARFEGPLARARQASMMRLGMRFMIASSRFHALHQSLARMREHGDANRLRRLETLVLETVQHLPNPDDEVQLVAQDAQWQARIRTLRDRLSHARHESFSQSGDIDSFEFGTACELLIRFVEALRECAASAASLADDTHTGPTRGAAFRPFTNGVAAAAAGLRAAVVIVAITSFWIATAWPSGVTAALIGGTICALVSATTKPARAAFQMAIGTLCAAVAGAFVVFGLYPLIDGFPLLCVVLAPFLAIGALLTSRKSLAGYGIGYSIFFCFLAGPDNVTSYAPAAYFNDALALVIAMLFASAAWLVVLPPSGKWLQWMLSSQLRGLVAKASAETSRYGFQEASNRFESRWRDFASQLTTRDVESGTGDDVQGWLLPVLEAGPALIELRCKLADGAISDSLKSTIEAAIVSVETLFHRPGPKHYRHALSQLEHAISGIRHCKLDDDANLTNDTTEKLRQATCDLYVLETVLRNRQSPFRPFAIAESTP